MKLERWNGMVESDAAAGCVWWHLTVIHKGNKVGILFDAKLDLSEAELTSIGIAKYKERYPGDA